MATSSIPIGLPNENRFYGKHWNCTILQTFDIHLPDNFSIRVPFLPRCFSSNETYGTCHRCHTLDAFFGGRRERQGSVSFDLLFLSCLSVKVITYIVIWLITHSFAKANISCWRLFRSSEYSSIEQFSTHKLLQIQLISIPNGTFTSNQCFTSITCHR